MQTPPPNRHSERAAYRRVIPRRFVDLALVTQNRGFEPMDLEITVFILYNKKEKSKRIHIVRWEACLRKTERAAIRRYGQPARTAPAYTPEQQRRRNGLRCAALFLRLRTAPRTGLRPRAGWLRLRAGAPTRRAAFGSRAARAAGGRLRAGSAIRNIERIPQDRRTVGRRASAAGPAVVAVSIKSRTESEQNTASLWSDAKTSDTGRTTPSCPLAFRQGWTQRPAALNCRKAASANKRTCLGGSSGN